MKANEEGLTREERIMFALLSIILIVAIGVLVIKNFSDNERILIEDAPINEKGQDVDAEANLEPSKSENSLIEVAPEKVVNTKNNTSYKKAYLAAAPKEEKKKYSAIYKDIEDRFQGFFGTKVKLDAGARSGKIIIKYSTNDELERLLELINK